MKSNQIFSLILSLFLAQICAAKVLIDEPRDCLKQGLFPCAIRSQELGQKLSLKNIELSMGDGTSVIFYSQKEWRLLEGQLWIRNQKDLQLSSGIMRLTLSGDSWVERPANEQVLVRNLNGSVRVESPLLGLNQVIPMGFENWYSLIASDGYLSQGVLKSIDARNFIPQWAKLSQLPKKQAIEQASVYKKSWFGNVEASANLYQEVVTRRFASIAAEEDEKLRRERNKADQQMKLRQMFHERFEER